VFPATAGERLRRRDLNTELELMLITRCSGMVFAQKMVCV
jgi:hypothetical protein